MLATANVGQRFRKERKNWDSDKIQPIKNDESVRTQLDQVSAITVSMDRVGG